MTNRIIKAVVFMGSARDISPPWGGSTRLGDRVLKWVIQNLQERSSTCGSDNISYEVTVYDPLVVFAPNGALAHSGGELTAPHFFMKKDEVPLATQEMANTIKAADCYIVVTPEYNHSIPPALTSMMGHFGGSNYAYKPCGIVTYSPSPWGGMRAAMALRPFLAELGCLSVSKLVGFGNAGELFNEDGTASDSQHRMLKQFPDMLRQLEWLTIATMNQRLIADLP